MTDSGNAAMTGPSGRQPTGPSRVWYWVAGAAMAASLIWLGLASSWIRAFAGQVDGYRRVPIPGQAELRSQ